MDNWQEYTIENSDSSCSFYQLNRCEATVVFLASRYRTREIVCMYVRQYLNPYRALFVVEHDSVLESNNQISKMWTVVLLEDSHVPDFIHHPKFPPFTAGWTVCSNGKWVWSCCCVPQLSKSNLPMTPDPLHPCPRRTGSAGHHCASKTHLHGLRSRGLLPLHDGIVWRSASCWQDGIGKAKAWVCRFWFPLLPKIRYYFHLLMRGKFTLRYVFVCRGGQLFSCSVASFRTSQPPIRSRWSSASSDTVDHIKIGKVVQR